LNAGQVHYFLELSLKAPPNSVFDHSFERVVMKLLSGSKNKKHLHEETKALHIIEVVQTVDTKRINARCFTLIRHHLKRITVLSRQRLCRCDTKQLRILAKFETNEYQSQQDRDSAYDLYFFRPGHEFPLSTNVRFGSIAAPQYSQDINI